MLNRFDYCAAVQSQEPRIVVEVKSASRLIRATVPLALALGTEHHRVNSPFLRPRDYRKQYPMGVLVRITEKLYVRHGRHPFSFVRLRPLSLFHRLLDSVAGCLEFRFSRILFGVLLTSRRKE